MALRCPRRCHGRARLRRWLGRHQRPGPDRHGDPSPRSPGHHRLPRAADARTRTRRALEASFLGAGRAAERRPDLLEHGRLDLAAAFRGLARPTGPRRARSSCRPRPRPAPWTRASATAERSASSVSLSISAGEDVSSEARPTRLGELADELARAVLARSREVLREGACLLEAVEEAPVADRDAGVRPRSRPCAASPTPAP